MKNEEIEQLYRTSAELIWDEIDEDFDENWLVSGADLFNIFDESETDLSV